MPSSNSLVRSKAPPAAARLAPFLAVLLLSTAACLGGAPSDREVLIALTDEVVVPAYRQLASDAAELRFEDVTFIAGPGASETTRQIADAIRHKVSD